MLTFEQALDITRKYSAPAAYEDEELRLLFDCAMEVPLDGTMVEIGCEFGRSTSLLMQVAEARRNKLILIELHPKLELIEMLNTFNYPYMLLRSTSVDAPYWFDSKYFHFVHIDGCHDYPDVKADLENFAMLCSGWTVCHDYERPTLEDVKIAVDEFVKTLGENVDIRKAGSAFAFKEL